MKNRQILFARRPQGWVTPECFAAGEAAVPEPGPGQFVIRNIYMSLDPYMRGMMNPQRSYAAPLEPGDVMAARVVGQVTASNHADYQEGDYVFAISAAGVTATHLETLVETARIAIPHESRYTTEPTVSEESREDDATVDAASDRA